MPAAVVQTFTQVVNCKGSVSDLYNIIGQRSARFLFFSVRAVNLTRTGTAGVAPLIAMGSDNTTWLNVINFDTGYITPDGPLLTNGNQAVSTGVAGADYSAYADLSVGGLFLQLMQVSGWTGVHTALIAVEGIII